MPENCPVQSLAPGSCTPKVRFSSRDQARTDKGLGENRRKIFQKQHLAGFGQRMREMGKWRAGPLSYVAICGTGRKGIRYIWCTVLWEGRRARTGPR